MLWRIWPPSQVDLLEFHNDMKWKKFQSPADLSRSLFFVHSIKRDRIIVKHLCASKQTHIWIFSLSWPAQFPHVSQLSSTLMAEPGEPYRTHHMLLAVIGSLGASLLTLSLNGNVKHYRQPDAACTLSHVQTNKHVHTQTQSHMQKHKVHACARAYIDTCEYSDASIKHEPCLSVHLTPFSFLENKQTNERTKRSTNI